MSRVQANRGVVRRTFGKIGDVAPVPNLIEVQSKSFNDFVQLDYLSSEREKMGLEKVLRDIFPIDYDSKMSLEYVSYELGTWECTCGKLTGIENRYTWSCSSCKKTACSRLDSSGVCSFCKKDTAAYKTCSNCLSRVRIKVPFTLEECRSSDQTFSLPLRIKIQLITWDIDSADKKIVRDVKEQDIFFADLPIMTDLYEDGDRYKVGSEGTFLINGIDRVVVSQVHRSPGAVFTHSKKMKDVRGRPYYLARIIPMRGSWIDFEFDVNDHLYVRIDKKKKFLATTFLQALGIVREDILPLFYAFDTVQCRKGEFVRPVDATLHGMRIEKGMLPAKLEERFLGTRVSSETVAALKKAKIAYVILRESTLVSKVFGLDVVDSETGEILAEQGSVCIQELLERFKQFDKLIFRLIASPSYVVQPTIAATLKQDQCVVETDALKELHAKVWPGDNASLKEVKERLEGLFFSPRLYDLTRVGRIRINRKFGVSTSADVTTLTREDIIETMRYLIGLFERAEGELDDIDHLGNRRVRLVGELLTNQVYVGFSRIERIIREKFRMQEPHGALMPQDFLNVKPLGAVIKEFFGMGQLSQFMDQTNPLSEIAHKRRLSALGPGGVMKDRATFEIRDVHTSHYGRICPIETPEGQTIGLISSLATYALVNDLGFIETAYRPVKNGKIVDEVIFLDAFEEDGKFIAQADVFRKAAELPADDKVVARHEGNFKLVDSASIDYVDLSPKQLVSVATALIPFLEHDDASRALMGSNMQRQAVPLLRCEVALVGTGMEDDVCRASGAALVAKRGGIVEYVSAEKIVIRSYAQEFGSINEWIAQGVLTYPLKKFVRSSYDTWIHQSPIVKAGDVVEAGDILSDGQAIDRGELALGSNVLVAFMPWHGYNFEDAIVVSKRLVADDTLTSVHLDEYIVEARETKLGPEEITRDIPNVSETALAGLDESGIVRVGTRVGPGDILVGKVTLKGDIQYSPEEKLLRAIFGEKSREVRDTSLRVPPGVAGTITNVKVFSRSGIRKDRRYRDIVAYQTEKLEKELEAQVKYLNKMICDHSVDLLAGKAGSGSAAVIKNGKFVKNKLQSLTLPALLALKPKDKKNQQALAGLKRAFDSRVRVLAGLKEERISNFKKGDTLPSGVIKMVKVYIAMKRHASVGDKIAGRHGNKGVISNIVPREDMPFLQDGTPVDVVLSPLGVPSRMNVGQILEVLLGHVGKKLGQQLEKLLKQQSKTELKKQLVSAFGKKLIADLEKEGGSEALMDLAQTAARHGVHFETPVFDGAHLDSDIKPMLRNLDMSETGAVWLRDGRTGDHFDQPVTVGYMYMMKLNHMVDDKLHARSVGPYSLVTQQPLGGKAQMGGQRLGEMEVWALEAYGAAYALQEMLTYKSDDVSGRHKVYESIVRAEDIPDPGLPESFNLMVKELQSLGLQVDLFKAGKEEVGE